MVLTEAKVSVAAVHNVVRVKQGEFPFSANLIGSQTPEKEQTLTPNDTHGRTSEEFCNSSAYFKIVDEYYLSAVPPPSHAWVSRFTYFVNIASPPKFGNTAGMRSERSRRVAVTSWFEALDLKFENISRNGCTTVEQIAFPLDGATPRPTYTRKCATTTIRYLNPIP